MIMVTAKSESENIVEALELGANDYVTKPVDFAVALARANTQIAADGQKSRWSQQTKRCPRPMKISNGGSPTEPRSARAYQKLKSGNRRSRGVACEVAISCLSRLADRSWQSAAVQGAA